MISRLQRGVFLLLRSYRQRLVLQLLDHHEGTLLDIGCSDLSFYPKLRDRFQVTLADSNPKDERIKRENLEALSFNDRSFDVVLCLEVLEHTLNPVAAIRELRRVSGKDLIISVPYEPFFSLYRFLIWESEHLWSITPRVLKCYLGEPAYEKKILWKRYYLAKWSFSPNR